LEQEKKKKKTGGAVWAKQGGQAIQEKCGAPWRKRKAPAMLWFKQIEKFNSFDVTLFAGVYISRYRLLEIS
jgi:hypothetical protein